MSDQKPVKVQITGTAYGQGRDGVKPTSTTEKNDGKEHDARESDS